MNWSTWHEHGTKKKSESWTGIGPITSRTPGLRFFSLSLTSVILISSLFIVTLWLWGQLQFLEIFFFIYILLVKLGGLVSLLCSAGLCPQLNCRMHNSNIFEMENGCCWLSVTSCCCCRFLDPDPQQLVEELQASTNKKFKKLNKALAQLVGIYM